MWLHTDISCDDQPYPGVFILFNVTFFFFFSKFPNIHTSLHCCHSSDLGSNYITCLSSDSFAGLTSLQQLWVTCCRTVSIFFSSSYSLASSSTTTKKKKSLLLLPKWYRVHKLVCAFSTHSLTHTLTYSHVSSNAKQSHKANCRPNPSTVSKLESWAQTGWRLFRKGYSLACQIYCSCKISVIQPSSFLIAAAVRSWSSKFLLTAPSWVMFCYFCHFDKKTLHASQFAESPTQKFFVYSTQVPGNKSFRESGRRCILRSDKCHNAVSPGDICKHGNSTSHIVGWTFVMHRVDAANDVPI